MGILFLSLSLNFLDSLYYKSTVINIVGGRWLFQYTPLGSLYSFISIYEAIINEPATVLSAGVTDVKNSRTLELQKLQAHVGDHRKNTKHCPSHHRSVGVWVRQEGFKEMIFRTES